MADKIDKALPNVKEKIHVESPEETIIEETQKLQEVTPTDPNEMARNSNRPRKSRANCR